jgi:hypothetical protein
VRSEGRKRRELLMSTFLAAAMYCLMAAGSRGLNSNDGVVRYLWTWRTWRERARSLVRSTCGRREGERSESHAHLVEDEEEEVEAREQRVWEVDVLGDALAFVVATVERIGSGQHGGTSVESGGNARLSDGDGLLLHHLVDGRPVRLVHLQTDKSRGREGGGTLSNSSMQQMPLSASTRAPPSSAMSPVI